MTEDTVIALLTNLVKPMLRDIPTTMSPDVRAQLAGEVAEAAWSGLALLMRQTLASGEPAALEEIGHFQRTAERIEFVPAASLLQAALMRDAPADAHTLMVERAVLYLQEGMALLQMVPLEARRLGAPAAALLTPEERLLRAILDQPVDADPLADRLSAVARSLNTMARRIGATAPPASHQARSRRRRRPATEGLERREQRPETTEEAGGTSLTAEP